MRTGRIENSRRRGAALVCLFALLSTLSWIRVLAVTGFAVLEGSHQVQISNPEGQWRLVLKHDCVERGQGFQFNRALGHRHPLGASLLVFLAQDPDSEKDHVLALGNCSENLVVPFGPKWAVPLVAKEILPCFAHSLPPGSRHEDSPPLLPRSPPPQASLQLQVRSTVLLI